MIDLTKCKLEELRAEATFILYRVRHEDWSHPRLALVPRNPSIAALEKLETEWSLAVDLDAAWAVLPIELISSRDDMMLVLDDPGGAPLSSVIEPSIGIERRLRLAVSVAHALDACHRRGLLHRDLSPANILVMEDGAVRLTGFGNAAWETDHRPLEAISGTLAYIAPEQTGRIDRAVDRRSDLYMLGVVLYELFAGALPFNATSAEGWIHSHIAGRPRPPNEHAPHLPAQIASIILKLLSKEPAERYQSAAGLSADLEKCLAAWTTRQRVEPFPLDRRGGARAFRFAPELCGRDREIASMRHIFDCIGSERRSAVVLISGQSGVGKSSLVRKFLSSLEPDEAFVAIGKFDRQLRDVPYAALNQAFTSLVRQILARNDDEVGSWRRAIAEAIGASGDLIAEIVPAIELLLGKQPVRPDLLPPDRAHRLRLAFRRLVGAFGRRGCPLVLFIDDLQWLDVATLEVLGDLVSHDDSSNMMLLGAYRADEAEPLGPLIEQIRTGRTLEELVLSPLTPGDMTMLIAGALGAAESQVRPLADLVHAKTGGNPFFAMQFMHTLADEGLLDYDPAGAVWTWNLALARAKGFTDNLADFMAAKLGTLDAGTRQILQTLACFGSSADVKDLAIAAGWTERQVETNLRPAIRAELVSACGTSCAFAHDRIQEAAYATIPEKDRPPRNLAIGMALTDNRDPGHLGEKLYIAAAQLNRGITAVATDRQRDRIVTVNLRAAQRARNATAYDAAITYLKVAAALLDDPPCPCDDGTRFAIALLRAECEFLTGHLDTAEALLLGLSPSCPDVGSRAEIARLRASMFTIRGQLKRGIDVSLEFLRGVGIDWSSKPSDATAEREGARLLAVGNGLSDEDLRSLPCTDDAAHRAIAAVLADLIPPAVLTDGNLADVVRLGAARLTLQHGICDQSCYLLTAAFQAVADRCKDPSLGFRLAKFGAELADREPQSAFSGRALMVFGHLVILWFQAIRSGQRVMHRAREYALATGDLAFVAYAYRGLISERLFCGDPLEAVKADADEALAFTDEIGFAMPRSALAVQRALITSLIGCDEEHRFECGGSIVPHPFEATQPIIAFFDYAAHIQIDVLAERHEAALEIARRAEQICWVAGNYPELVDYRFYAGLAHAAALDARPGSEAHLDGLRRHHSELAARCVHLPDNFADRLTLLAAEIARAERRQLDAEHLYEEAIRAARKSGFVQIEAIATERAAAFYQARGIDTAARSYLQNAHHCYTRWGARAKLDRLERSYPYLVEAGRAAATVIDLPLNQLDISALFTASRALSEGMMLNTVIRTLMHVVIEHAAVDRAVLFLIQEDRAVAVAEGRFASAGVHVQVWEDGHRELDVSTSVLNYVARTRSRVTTSDPATADLLRSDGYILQHRDICINCLPVVRQSRLVGILYLESRLERTVTQEQTMVLDLLAAQAAISLENARLFTELQRSEAFLAEGQRMSQSGSWSWRIHSNGLRCSRELYRILGLDPDHGTPRVRRIGRLIHPEDRTSVVREMRSSIKGGSPFSCELRLIGRDGHRHLRVVGRPEHDETGNLVGYVGTIIDMTDYKRTHDALHAARSDLAHAARLAAVGELTSVIAHEVRQPLTAIAAQASASRSWLTRQPPEIEEADAAAARIVADAHRASDILESIRNMTRKAPPSRAPVDINAVITETTALLNGEIRRQGITLKSELAAEVNRVAADRVQVQQVVMNLMVNGIEAMAAIGDRPRVLTVATQTTADAVKVTVTDVGTGLPSEDDRLFDAFFTTKPKGLGIGLAISRSIIESHGGHLRALSNRPHGCVFEFSLPISTQDRA